MAQPFADAGLAESGRGFAIMRACVAECVIDGTPFGTTVVLRSHPLAG